MKSNINISFLVKSAWKGDLKCQRAIFMEYYGHVFKIANRYLSYRVEVEEVCNDAFIKIFNHLNKYDTSLSFVNWISTITINTCIDHIRKKKREITYKELNIDITSEQAQDTFLDFDEETDILPILKELSPQYRAVFNLYVIEEYKHQEIADLLDISIGTSKSNLSRAKRIIAHQIINNPKYFELKSKRI